MKPSKETIQKFADRLDDLVKLPVFLEMFDGTVFRFVLEILAEKYWENIPTQYQDEVNILIEAFAENDYSIVSGATVTAINDLIDLPFADEEEEAQFIALNTQMILKFVLYLKDRPDK